MGLNSYLFLVECYNEFWTLFYIITSVMCDVLVIAAAVLNKVIFELSH